MDRMAVTAMQSQSDQKAVVQHLLWQRGHMKITHKKISKEVQRKSDISLDKSERAARRLGPVAVGLVEEGTVEVLGTAGEQRLKLDSGRTEISTRPDRSAPWSGGLSRRSR
jgi:hypothetical protein